MSSREAPRFCLSSKNRLPWRCRRCIPPGTSAAPADRCADPAGNPRAPGGWVRLPLRIPARPNGMGRAPARRDGRLRAGDRSIRSVPPDSPAGGAAHRPGSPRSSIRRPALIRRGAALVQPVARAPPPGNPTSSGCRIHPTARRRVPILEERQRGDRRQVGRLEGVLAFPLAARQSRTRYVVRSVTGRSPLEESQKSSALPPFLCPLSSLLLAALRPGGSPSPLRGSRPAI